MKYASTIKVFAIGLLAATVFFLLTNREEKRATNHEPEFKLTIEVFDEPWVISAAPIEAPVKSRDILEIAELSRRVSLIHEFDDYLTLHTPFSAHRYRKDHERYRRNFNKIAQENPDNRSTTYFAIVLAETSTQGFAFVYNIGAAYKGSRESAPKYPWVSTMGFSKTMSRGWLMDDTLNESKLHKLLDPLNFLELSEHEREIREAASKLFNKDISSDGAKSNTKN
jgi:hypothetical protein